MTLSEAITKIEAHAMALPIVDKWKNPFGSPEEILQQVSKFHGKRWDDVASDLESHTITAEVYCARCLVLIDEFARKVQGRRVLKRLIEMDQGAQ